MFETQQGRADGLVVVGGRPNVVIGWLHCCADTTQTPRLHLELEWQAAAGAHGLGDECAVPKAVGAQPPGFDRRRTTGKALRRQKQVQRPPPDMRHHSHAPKSGIPGPALP